MTDTIVVVGRRLVENDGSYRIQFSTGLGTPGMRYYTSRQVDENGGVVGDPEIGVAVKIEKTKTATDQAKLELAAQKLIQSVIETITALELADPTNALTILGRTTTVGEMLQTLLDTQFTVTDVTEFNNTGVGSAARGINGNLDTINYEAIIGSATRNGYADPGFPENSGMHALVLHEIAHMTQAGFEFFNHSFDVFGQDATVSGTGFHQTGYSTNVEAFANAIMTGISSQIGVDLHGVMPLTSQPPVSPESIYQSHTGSPFPA